MTITVYGCGGTGVNLVRQIDNPNVTVNYVDTSVSNLKNVRSDNVFLVEGMDGAGKHRATAFENFKDVCEDVLLKFPPSDKLNVVVSSLSGGSGGILNSLLTRELVKRNLPVIVIGIDSKSSVIELSNTLKTLQTFKSFSDSLKKPISIFHIENTSRKDADRQALTFITLMSLLVDKTATDEFDTSDLKSFIYYDKVTDNYPTVAILEIRPNEDIPQEKGTFVGSTILVTRDRASDLKGSKPDYFATCIVTDEGYTAEDLRINSVMGKLSTIIDSLETEIKTLADTKKVNKIRDVEVQANTDEGVVL